MGPTSGSTEAGLTLEWTGNLVLQELTWRLEPGGTRTSLESGSWPVTWGPRGCPGGWVCRGSYSTWVDQELGLWELLRYGAGPGAWDCSCWLSDEMG